MSSAAKKQNEDSGVDLDVVFAYKTDKKVKILDRKLGILYNAIMVLILFYVFGYVIIMNKGYIGSENAIGQVKIQLYGGGMMKVGDSNGKGIAFDGHDLRNPSIESGAIFLITKMETVKQKRGSTCGNPDFPCNSNKDCPLFPGVSSQECANGLCVMEGWCPEMGSSATKVHTLVPKLTNVSTWFRTSIQFPGLRPGVVFTNMDSSEPTFDEDAGETDAWPLDNLLSNINLNLKEIGDKGAMINARLQWNCNVDTNEGCRFPEIQVKRLDSGSGYNYYYPEYVRAKNLDPKSEIRMLHRLSGIRILVVSKGEGKGFSIPATILQVSSALALLTLSNTIVDGLMMMVLNEKRHYREYKEQVSPDFSDIREILETRSKEKH